MKKCNWNIVRAVMFGFICIMLSVSGDFSVLAADDNFNYHSTVDIPDQESYPVTGQYKWIRYRAPKDGYITVKASYGSKKYTYSLGYWRLYDSKKKTALSADKISYTTQSGTDAYARTSYFGVKKGKTYYLRVQAYDGVKISCRFKQVKEQSASSRKKAKTLKKSKTVTGIVLPKDKTKDWYKIRLSKAQKIRLYYKIRSDGRFKLSLYSGSGAKLCSGTYGYAAQVRQININQNGQKLNPGTYYFKWEPADSYSCGYYTVKWK